MNESGGGKRDAVDVIEIHLICSWEGKAAIGYVHLWMVNCPAHAYGRVINNIWLTARSSPSLFSFFFSFQHNFLCNLLYNSFIMFVNILYHSLHSSKQPFLKKKKALWISIFRRQMWNQKDKTCGYVLHLQSTFAAKLIKIAQDKNHKAEEYVI